MIAVRRLLLGFIAVFGLAGVSFAASASNIYVTQNGSPAGNCKSNVQSAAWLNSPANWGSGATQVGPGTTVLLCGTFTSSVQGGNAITVQGSGNASAPITILFDANVQMNSTGWWGTYNADACANCTGAITVNNVNYITIDGGGGIIQNLLNGTPGNSCAGGPCTQQSGSKGSLGIHLAGDNLIVRNLTIQNIYSNAGSDSSASDTGGSATADIRVDGAPTNLQIYGNILNDARAGIWGGFNGSTGANGCPSSGICIYNNKLSDHPWQMLLNSAGKNNVVNVYNNEIGDIGDVPGWLNWQYPTSTYHQDGIFLWGTSGEVVTANIYNNYIHGDLGQGSPSGMIYCTNDGSGGDGTGCNPTAFNNVIVGTGSAATNDQMIAVGLASGDTISVTLYNNTLVGGAYSLEIYNGQGGVFPLVIKNNVFFPGSAGSPRYYFHQENSGSVYSAVTASNNVYYNGNNEAWDYQGTTYNSLSTWQGACKCDTSLTMVGNPNLSSNYVPQSGSPATGLGANLTALGMSQLDVAYNGITRSPSGACTPGVAGCWDAGANMFGANPPSPPTGLAAVVQ